MKRSLLILASVLLIGGLASNKCRAQSKVDFGIRAGVNFTNIADENFDATTHTGFLGGFYTRVKLPHSPVSVQPEVLYSQKGFTYNHKVYRIDYVEVPLLARIDIHTSQNFVPHIYVGPYIGFKANTKLPSDVIYDSEVYTGDQYCLQPANYPCCPYYACGPPRPDTEGFHKDDINGVDVGITVGGGLDFGPINLGVRYDAGLTEISEDDAVSAKNSAFSILTAIDF